MNYERLTVDNFETRLKSGTYSGLTGARRAIGKADWSKKDKERAQELANKFYESGGKPTKAPTKAPKPTKTKTAAKAKTAKPAKTAAPKTATSKSHTSESTPVRQPVAMASPLRAARLGSLDDTRFNSAAAVIASFANRGALTPAEQEAYDISLAEFTLEAQPAARKPPERAPKRQPVVRQPEAVEDEEATPAVRQNEQVAAPRIVIPPNGADDLMTAEQREQHERLKKAAAAIPATLGQQS